MYPSEQLKAGQAKSIPAYYEGQNANGVPDHYLSVKEANQLKKTGKARSIHRGRAVLIYGIRTFRQDIRESLKSRWRVVGQTKRGGRPGCPRWNLV